MLGMGAAKVTNDRLEWHLWNWERYIHSGEMRQLWFSKRAAVCVGNGTVADFDALCAVEDNRCALAVDAAVNSLPSVQRCAVHHKHTAAVFRFPRANLETEYEQAKVSIRRHLMRTGIE